LQTMIFLLMLYNIHLHPLSLINGQSWWSQSVNSWQFSIVNYDEKGTMVWPFLRSTNFHKVMIIVIIMLPSKLLLWRLLSYIYNFWCYIRWIRFRFANFALEFLSSIMNRWMNSRRSN
jgi:hypothetical protein